ncbi:Gfo/Idh/MocA family protein [Cohnella sp. WQ 127256]|uniref:Gfo/Idh/MocA family protein n=1 Tax=Cohnella sp. WQ 127256 TaxID=2938790 RepID=UPI0021181C5C|nr:Gfo/Idh/MocA family oxidoreductase [Cohnella sp. WQ 127256]
MTKLKVGMIGVGEVAQIIHLPILESLPELYEMAAFCDISPKLLAKMGEKYRVSNLYANATEMLERTELDAVFVLNNMEYHTDCTVAALQRNIHVFVEKPMCVTEAEAHAIIRARDASDAQVMVGYMRRFAPAYLRALEEVRTLGPINYARVRDIIGPNAYFTSQSGTRVYRYDDIPAEAVQDRKMRNARLMKEAIGEQSPETYAAYGLLLGLNSHDVSAMREMLGMPRSVKAVGSSHGGRFKTAILEFDGYNAVFETGVDQQGRFDAHIEVYGEKKSVLVQYDTPYLRQLPTTLRIRETIGDALEETVIRPTYKDAYTCELEYFHQVAATGIPPKTTPEDYLKDLEIFGMMMDTIK